MRRAVDQMRGASQIACGATLATQQQTFAGKHVVDSEMTNTSSLIHIKYDTVGAETPMDDAASAVREESERNRNNKSHVPKGMEITSHMF